MTRYIRNLLFILSISIVEASNFNGECCGAVMKVSEEDDLRQAISNKNINIICVQRKTHSETTISKLFNDNIKEIFTLLDQKIDNDKWTIVVFSENFFGNSNNILDLNDVTQIVTECNAFTARHPKSIIHINFLQEFNVNKLNEQCQWLHAPYATLTFDQCKDRIIQPIFKDILLLKDSLQHVANYSLIIWNGHPIAIYRKSTYCNEANALVIGCSSSQSLSKAMPQSNLPNPKHLYEFGNFQTHSLLTSASVHAQIAGLFTGSSPLIATRICADMNPRFLEKFQPECSIILIVPANYKTVNESNLPKGIFAVFSDTALGISFININGTVIRKQSPESFVANDFCNIYCYDMNKVVSSKSAVDGSSVKNEEPEVVDVPEEIEEDSFCVVC